MIRRVPAGPFFCRNLSKMKEKNLRYDKLIPSSIEICICKIGHRNNINSNEHDQMQYSIYKYSILKHGLGPEYYAYTQTGIRTSIHFRTFLFMHMFTKMSSIANIIIYFNFSYDNNYSKLCQSYIQYNIQIHNTHIIQHIADGGSAHQFSGCFYLCCV